MRTASLLTVSRSIRSHLSWEGLPTPTPPTQADLGNGGRVLSNPPDVDPQMQTPLNAEPPRS